MIEYFEKLPKISRVAKIFLVSGIALVIYGCIAQIAKIYFFWESGSIGWFLLLIGSIIFCTNLINVKYQKRANSTVEQIVTYALIFILAIKSIVLGSFIFSDAFETASSYLETNSQIKSEIGLVSGVILVSDDEINTRSNADGESGQGVLNLIAKGTRKYKKYTIHIIKKQAAEKWQVVQVKEVE